MTGHKREAVSKEERERYIVAAVAAKLDDRRYITAESPYDDRRLVFEDFLPNPKECQLVARLLYWPVENSNVCRIVYIRIEAEDLKSANQSIVLDLFQARLRDALADIGPDSLDIVAFARNRSSDLTSVLERMAISAVGALRAT